jgi:uncharacterized membrane protein YhaH (DUF805 family)
MGGVVHAADVGQLLRFFFTAGGRIARREYLLGLAFIYAANAALLAVAMHQADRDLALGLVIMVSAFPSTVAQFVLVAKRCHDIGLSGAFVLVLLIPFVGLVWLSALAAIVGNSGPNAYGPPPRFDPI